ncbi:MAG: ABC transporter ATP-binding protein [Solibacillus sp.]|uniref:ABC transporter ATP-binding protein n=1 Tax=unclassified Solibacillus TaxID=2637870 RepID=UPI0030F98DC0
MKNVIELQHVHKKFKGFELNDLSFNVKKGYITGFIGGNGAGKSTTIKLMMNLLQPNEGDITVFGLKYKEHEKEIKNRIGFVFDEDVFYEELTLKKMKKIVSLSYSRWNEELFQHYVKIFELPLNKRLKQLSKGMKMKASLAIALSHEAELIIMDEPTSGLDPVFRRELLQLLHDIMQDGDKTIFFSTHNTTDLDRIADYITFVHKGSHVFTKDMTEIEESYVVVKGELALLDEDIVQEFIGLEKSRHGFVGLSDNKASVEALFGNMALIEKATLEDIMYYTKKGR